MATPNSSRSWAVATRARAVPDAGFSRCCRTSGAFDDVEGDYYLRD
jgi:hypothetical protein